MMKGFGSISESGAALFLSCLIRSIQERSEDPKLAMTLPNMYYLPILGQLSQWCNEFLMVRA